MVAYRIERIRSHFTRYGYAITLFHDDGTPYTPWLPVKDALDQRSIRTRYAPCPMPATFFGNNDRQVRAEAVAWAKQYTVVGI